MSNVIKRELGFLQRSYNESSVIISSSPGPTSMKSIKTEGTKVTSLYQGEMDDVRGAEMYLKTEQYINGFGLRFVKVKLKNEQYITGFVLRFEVCRSKGNRRTNST